MSPAPAVSESHHGSTVMDQKLDTLNKKDLVEIVKLVQKQGMQGSAGSWKEFLNIYDKKFGSSLSDPAKRSKDVLVSFLQTFTKEDDLKFFAKLLHCHMNRSFVEHCRQSSLADKSPEQRLVCLTLGDPRYTLDYSFPSCDEEWVVTELSDESKVLRSNAMYAVDCEMVLCEDGSEAVVRVCVVNQKLKVKVDKFVKPEKPVADYRSEITGVTAEDLVDVTCSLADIQKRMKKLLSDGAILVGHGLHNDLKVLKLDHARVIDTAYIFKYSEGLRRPSLNNSCKSVLGSELRKAGAPHNCLDDACAAMKLVRAVIEHDGDDDITIIKEDVSETERAKLLLHRIPIKVPSGDLNRAVLGEFTLEVKPPRNAQGGNYTAVAIFKSSIEANQAFENVEGDEEKDSSGRPQKLVTFQSSTGENVTIYVRKMAPDNPPSQTLAKKRAFEGGDESSDPKKLRMQQEDETMPDSRHCESQDNSEETERLKTTVGPNGCGDLFKEIDRLKQELKEQNCRISAQDKIISDLKRKVKEIKKGKKNKRH